MILLLRKGVHSHCSHAINAKKGGICVSMCLDPNSVSRALGGWSARHSSLQNEQRRQLLDCTVSHKHKSLIIISD